MQSPQSCVRCSKHDRPESGREILCGLRLYGYAPGHRRSCRHRVTAIRGATEDSLFLFSGRRTDRIKALYFSGDGYVLLYKRLNNGAFQWPRSEQELRLLDKRSFRWLMEGLKPEQPKAIQKCKSKIYFRESAVLQAHFMVQYSQEMREKAVVLNGQNKSFCSQ